MLANETKVELKDVIERVSVAADANELASVENLLLTLNPAEIAHVLEAIPNTTRAAVFKLVPDKFNAEVLVEMGEVAASELAESLDTQTLQDATEEMDAADIAELFDVLPEESQEDLLKAMDTQRRERVQATLSYADETAGRLMQDAVNIRPDVTVETVLRYMRALDDIPADTVNLMVVHRSGQFVGLISVIRLMRSEPEKLIKDIMQTDVKTLHPDDDEKEVAILFETHDLIVAPVIDHNDQFLGRVVIDDVVDIIREQGEHAFLGQAGLDDEEDLFGPTLPSAKRRAIWLALNLLTAFFAAWVIGLFEVALDKIVALAILMPIVASMGGIAGTQTLTLTVRGLALGQIGRNNARKLLNKELGIGFINGCLWATVVGVVAWMWFSNPQIGIVIAVAMVLNMVIAAVVGILVPLFLQKINLDPALSGAVVVTTVTDVVGFMSFLGLATIFLL